MAPLLRDAQAGVATGSLAIRFALGGLSFVAALVAPANRQREAREENVRDHPDLGGQIDTAPGSISGTATIKLLGHEGQPGREIGVLLVDNRHQLREVRQGPVLGETGQGRIEFTAIGEAWLQARVASGGEAGSPSAEPIPRIGASYETRTQEEADLAASMTAQGRSSLQIEAAIEELRKRPGGGANNPSKPPEPAPPTTSPTSAAEQVWALPGHGNARHGSHTTLEQQRTRLLTKVAPDGTVAPTNKATRFDSPEAQMDAVNRAMVWILAREAAGKIDPPTTTRSGTLQALWEDPVVTGFPGGYGSGLEKIPSRSGASKVIVSTGQMPNARVAMTREVGSNEWRLVTQYPTDDPVDPEE